MTQITWYHEPSGELARVHFTGSQVVIDEVPTSLPAHVLRQAVEQPIESETGEVVNGAIATVAVTLHPGTQEHFDALGRAQQIVALGLFVVKEE